MQKNNKPTVVGMLRDFVKYSMDEWVLFILLLSGRTRGVVLSYVAHNEGGLKQHVLTKNGIGYTA